MNFRESPYNKERAISIDNTPIREHDLARLLVKMMAKDSCSPENIQVQASATAFGSSMKARINSFAQYVVRPPFSKKIIHNEGFMGWELFYSLTLQ